MTDKKHLWEVNHSYYCSESNYYNNECSYRNESWEEFIEEQGDYDLDMNLIFRWDWNEGEDYELDDFNGDNNFKNGVLMLFVMHQRKGRFISIAVSVCRNDEDKIIEFLTPRLNHLKEMWEPLK